MHSSNAYDEVVAYGTTISIGIRKCDAELENATVMQHLKYDE
jgi:hypothetical protein